MNSKFLFLAPIASTVAAGILGVTYGRSRQNDENWIEAVKDVAGLDIGNIFPRIFAGGDTKKNIEISFSLAAVKYNLQKKPHDYRMIVHSDHIVCYDHRNLIPRWVYEHLTRSNLKPDEKIRPRDFNIDVNVSHFFRSRSCDYENSGYVKGMLAVGENHRHEIDAYTDVHKMSNVIPMTEEVRNGIWKHLAADALKLVEKHDNVYVISGPVFAPEQRADRRKYVKYELIKGKIAVPTHFFQVVFYEDSVEKKYKYRYYLVPNEDIVPINPAAYATHREKVCGASGLSLFKV